MPLVTFTQMDYDARLPERSYKEDACDDVRINKNVKIYPGQVVQAATGIISEITPGFFIEFRPRSGLASDGMVIANSPATIDSNYRGEWKLLLGNIGEKLIVLETGDRAVQMRVVRLSRPRYKIDKIRSWTTRGSDGIGSTGLA